MQIEELGIKFILQNLPSNFIAYATPTSICGVGHMKKTSRNIVQAKILIHLITFKSQLKTNSFLRYNENSILNTKLRFGPDWDFRPTIRYFSQTE